MQMQKAIIGKKVGMTQIFDESGKVIPVTVIEAGPCVVTQKKTTEKDGYNAVQLGFEDVKESKLTKPELGHLKKAEVALKKHLKEFRVEKAAGQALRRPSHPDDRTYSAEVTARGAISCIIAMTRVGALHILFARSYII